MRYFGIEESLYPLSRIPANHGVTKRVGAYAFRDDKSNPRKFEQKEAKVTKGFGMAPRATSFGEISSFPLFPSLLSRRDRVIVARHEYVFSACSIVLVVLRTRSYRTLRDGSFGGRFSRHFVPGYDRCRPSGARWQTFRNSIQLKPVANCPGGTVELCWIQADHPAFIGLSSKPSLGPRPRTTESNRGG